MAHSLTGACLTYIVVMATIFPRQSLRRSASQSGRIQRVHSRSRLVRGSSVTFAVQVRAGRVVPALPALCGLVMMEEHDGVAGGLD